ncbi:MAG TPA: response regulator [Candidatus Paceibacterota bacterium]|nr:response regulator [Candidatus Paceibacterota bacterium]
MNNSLSGKSIVWIEDDKFLGKMVSDRIGKTGARLAIVTDGLKAFETVRAEMPDVVILDLLMSNLDGFEILKLLKADPATKPIPVLVLSNLGQQEEIARARELGAARFVVKATIGLDGIIPEIEKVISSR